MNDLITWLRAQLTIDDRGLRDWLSNLPADSGAADWVRQWLAEVDAKRRILTIYENAVLARDAGSPGPVFLAGEQISQWNHAVDHGAADVLTDAVRLLALPYAAREGYRDEWRPW
jgi:hypothetical protein